MIYTVTIKTKHSGITTKTEVEAGSMEEAQAAATRKVGGFAVVLGIEQDVVKTVKTPKPVIRSTGYKDRNLSTRRRPVFRVLV